jgi:hypothetical protein
MIIKIMLKKHQFGENTLLAIIDCWNFKISSYSYSYLIQ